MSKIIVGLEIGTTKTCMVVGEINPDATTTIIGFGEVPSAGVEKGEINDVGMARRCVCDAWQLAQDHAEVDIVNVYLSVTGEHICGKNSLGSYRLPDGESRILESHMERARENATQPDLPVGCHIINTHSEGFSIDGGEPTRYPRGLSGSTLDMHSHVIYGSTNRFQTSYKCVREVPIEVNDLIFAPLATAQVVTTRQQRDSGALVIDIGGGTTDYICYVGGEIVASGCIPVGGNNINQDLIQLSEQRMQKQAAEIFKCTEGNAVGDRNDSSRAFYRSDNGLHEVSIERGLLNKIIYERLREILMLVKAKIPADVWKRRGMGVFFSGGTSLMKGLEPLAHHVFGVTIHQPAPLPADKEKNFLMNPSYCTAVGLIRYAQVKSEEHTLASSSSWFSRFLNIFRSGN